MNFHEVRFPAAISLGATGGPERRTEIVTLASGHEERNATWAHARRRYDAGLGLRRLDDVHAVLAFFEARRGRLYGFRWKDWADHKSCPPSQTPTPVDCALGVGDGVLTAFQLVKSYVSGPALYARPIAKPVAGSVRLAVDGTELAEGVDFTVDATTGIVALAAAPAPGAAVTAGFAFDVPVRFETDRLEVNLAAFEAGAIPSAPVVEVRV
ncbi:DUF2460 domain-containing protein [Rubrimonas cliftonensis]|uniref:TIGR02217 family protein n=1 Tax=Rubrimonas cliftonensis TaxID=89524 RepID=A0A1H3ZGX3_9RHOB|nr:DUF2460 domain-containing protein [Rubrimonas cliftonensis]SEA22907.1 TIGR02217 family protein [Rubrimonas cliftonensis]